MNFGLHVLVRQTSMGTISLSAGKDSDGSNICTFAAIEQPRVFRGMGYRFHPFSRVHLSVDGRKALTLLGPVGMRS